MLSSLAAEIGIDTDKAYSLLESALAWLHSEFISKLEELLTSEKVRVIKECRSNLTTLSEQLS